MSNSQCNRHSFERCPNPKSHLTSGRQVRGLKHNPQSCPEIKLQPCQGGSFPPSHRPVPRSRWAPGPSNSGSGCCFDGSSQVSSELAIWPRNYPIEVRSCKWAASTQPDSGLKKSKIDPSLRLYEGRGKATLYPSTATFPEDLCTLVPPDSSATWSHVVAQSGQCAKVGETGRF